VIRRQLRASPWGQSRRQLRAPPWGQSLRQLRAIPWGQSSRQLRALPWGQPFRSGHSRPAPCIPHLPLHVADGSRRLLRALSRGRPGGLPRAISRGITHPPVPRQRPSAGRGPPTHARLKPSSEGSQNLSLGRGRRSARSTRWRPQTNYEHLVQVPLPPAVHHQGACRRWSISKPLRAGPLRRRRDQGQPWARRRSCQTWSPRLSPLALDGEVLDSHFLSVAARVGASSRTEGACARRGYGPRAGGGTPRRRS